MSNIPNFNISQYCLRIFLGVLAVCLALVFTAHTSAYAGQNQNKNNRGGSGIGVGVGITLDVSKINKKKKTKKKATTTKPTRKKARTKKTRTKKAKTKKTRRTAAARAPNIPKFRSNHILGFFVSNTPDDVINAVAAEFGLQRLADSQVQLTDLRMVKFSMPRRMTPLRALELANDPRVISAQPNYLYRMSGAAKQYAIQKMDIPKAHEMVSGKGVIVAVIDSGVRTKHTALKDVVIEQFNAVGKRRHKDFSHGTGIASIISARRGMVGVAPDAKILSSIAFAKDKKRGHAMAETYDIVRSIDWALSKQAQIINMSFTGARDPALHETLTAVQRAGAIAVAAAGNLGPKASPAYPAAYPEVIAVTATDAKNRLYRHANQGDYVTIAAPGVDVLVAQRKRSFGLMSGTSAATAYVAGALALVSQHRKQLDPQSAVNLMAQSAQDLGDRGRDRKYGYGLLNVYNIITTETVEQTTSSQTSNKALAAD